MNRTVTSKIVGCEWVFPGAIILAVVMAALWTGQAFANHPVLVEGEQDYDGDGLIGAAEDADIDPVGFPVFGTISSALAAANAGANQNGRVTIVTSGRFREQVNINGLNGNVTLEAAPGVEANIDAVASGDTNNAARQAVAGIVIDAPNTRIITLRNLVSRNWTAGVKVLGDSRVLIHNCRLENNLNYGVRIQENARVTIDECQVSGAGFRVGTAVSTTPNPGIGIQFEDDSSGFVCDSTVVGSFLAGIKNATGNANAVRVQSSCLFDNNPNLVEVATGL